MQRSWPTLLRWGAIVALALLALAIVPHFHDAADGHDDTCVMCHVHGSPLIASNTHDNPDPTSEGRPHAQTQANARNAEVKDHGSRAPPA